MTKISGSEAAKAVVRRNTHEVQGGGNFEVFEELFADDFIDHTPQPGRTPDKAGARELYKVLRAAFPDFHADIHWQLADGDRVTQGRVLRHGANRSQNSVRDRGRDARARRQDHRALGRGQSLLSYAATRRVSRHAEGVNPLPDQSG
jgi:SnoaL-like polyketide cyclase